MLCFTHEDRANLIRIVKQDSQFLSRSALMDYSILLAIEEVPEGMEVQKKKLTDSIPEVELYSNSSLNGDQDPVKKTGNFPTQQPQAYREVEDDSKSLPKFIRESINQLQFFETSFKKPSAAPKTKTAIQTESVAPSNEPFETKKRLPQEEIYDHSNQMTLGPFESLSVASRGEIS